MDTHFAITRLAGIEGSWRHESPSWGLTTESLVAFVRPILIYAAPIWFTQVFSIHLDKLQVIQSKGLRITTGGHQKAAVSHPRDRGPPPEGALGIVFSAILFQRPPKHAPQSSNSHRPPPPQGLSPVLLLYLEGPVNNIWRPQRFSSLVARPWPDTSYEAGW